MRRFSTLTAVVGGLALTTLLLAGCGSDKAADTTVATTETTVVADTVAAEPAAEETVAADTVAAETVAAETAPADTVAADTAAAGEATDTAAAAGAAGELTQVFVSQMLMGMTGATSADPTDVQCISEKVSEADLSKLVTATGTEPDANAMKAIVKAAFQCKPKGLTDNLFKEAFASFPADVTDTQKSCLSEKALDIIANDDSVIDAMMQSSSKMPESLKSKLTTVTEDCLPAGAARDAVLEELLKD